MWFDCPAVFCTVIIRAGMWSISTRQLRSTKSISRYLPLPHYPSLPLCAFLLYVLMKYLLLLFSIFPSVSTIFSLLFISPSIQVTKKESPDCGHSFCCDLIHPKSRLHLKTVQMRSLHLQTLLKLNQLIIYIQFDMSWGYLITVPKVNSIHRPLLA